MGNDNNVFPFHRKRTFLRHRFFSGVRVLRMPLANVHISSVPDILKRRATVTLYWRVTVVVVVVSHHFLFFFPQKYRHCCYSLALWMLYDFVFFFRLVFYLFVFFWNERNLNCLRVCLYSCMCVCWYFLFVFHFTSFSFSLSPLTDILIPNIDLTLNYVVVVSLNFELYPSLLRLNVGKNIRIPLNYTVNECIRNFYHSEWNIHNQSYKKMYTKAN